MTLQTQGAGMAAATGYGSGEDDTKGINLFILHFECSCTLMLVVVHFFDGVLLVS